MGFLDWLFGKRADASDTQPAPRYTDRDAETVRASGQRLVDIINESLTMANESRDIETKLSRLGVAKSRLEDLKELSRRFPFIKLTYLSEVEDCIRKLEMEFITSGLREIAAGNQRGEALEKAGRIDEAIAQYERLAQQGVDTPFTYRRLAVIYRKRKEKNEEERVVNMALRNVPETNAAHYAWFQERMEKLRHR